MTSISLRRYYGFSNPYDFRVAIPFLLNVMGAVAAIMTAAVMLLSDTLTIGTQRFYFFAYLILTLGLAALLSRTPRISMAIFLWCCIEAVLALSSNLVPPSIYATQLFPSNDFARPEDRRFVHHPLLQITPRKNWRHRHIFDERNRSAHAIWPKNWGQIGGEFEFHHNSLGLRGPELSARDYSLDLIFVYGGSTTYEVTVSQGDTWPEELQRLLAGKFTVLNFGVPMHSTTEHLIHTAFYQSANGNHPVCAVYYIGWNDIHNAHLDDLDPAYADRHLLGTPRRRPELPGARYSPIIQLINQTLSVRFDTIPWPPILSGEAAETIPDIRLESIFSNNVRTIASINRSRGIQTVFIGQILNTAYFLTDPEVANAWAPRIKNGNIWPTQQHFNRLLEATASASGAAYIDAGINNFSVDDFADQGHFAAAGSRKFARLIAHQVEASCKSPATR